MSNNRNIDVEELAACFRALSNPHRLRIFQEQLNCCPPGTRFSTEDGLAVCVGKITESMNLAPSTISHHLKELRQAGLVQMERKGRKIECWIDPEKVETLAAFFTDLSTPTCCTTPANCEQGKETS